MNSNNLKVFFYRRDVKTIIIGTAVGGILQILAQQYIKNNPELFQELQKQLPKSKKRTPRWFIPRGGEFISTMTLLQLIIAYIGDYGVKTGLFCSLAVLLAGTPKDEIALAIRNAMVQIPHETLKSQLPIEKLFVLVDGEKIYLDKCDQPLKYLFSILDDESIPFEERRKAAHSILTKRLSINTQSGRRNLALCLTFIIYILFKNKTSSFYIIMKGLIEAVREGKITKQVARIIVRRLKRKGVPVDPELIELVAS